MIKELEVLETLKDMLIGNGVNGNITDYIDNLILPIKQALIQMEKCLGARRNEKALEQMYQLVKYSKAPMKAALWVTNIDGKIEQRVIVEKKDYDIKSEKEQAWEYMKEVFKTSSTYTNKLKDSLECGWITQEKYDFIMEMLE